MSGGAAKSAILGERFGASIDHSALAQPLRIMIAIVINPFALTLLYAHGADSCMRVLAPAQTAGLVPLPALSLRAGAPLFRIARGLKVSHT